MEERTVKYLYSYTIGVLMAIFLLGTTYQDIKREEITITHTVRQGETLWEISEKYITPDRYMPEFVEEIYALNYERVFAKREKNGAPRKSVYSGDELEIHYWQTPKEEGDD